jgi:hypothetical protein
MKDGMKRDRNLPANRARPPAASASGCFARATPGSPRSRHLVQQLGWHVRSFQGDEVAGIWDLNKFGGGQQLLVGLSV